MEEGSDGSGWFADPEIEGQERYFDGAEWTSETRPADPDTPLVHLPEHTGELQRALAAATDDIDEVEDRLGTLFDRAAQVGERGGRARRAAEARAQARADGGSDRADADAGPGQSVSLADVGAGATGAAETASTSVGPDEASDDDGLAELDEALASEEPEKVKRERKFFRRRS